MVAMKPIQEWIGEPGVVISWHPSRASLAKVREAPVSDVPTSYQQEQHLLAYRKHLAEGTDMARLIIGLGCARAVRCARDDACDQRLSAQA